jgi:AGCS family alanine or glycine:cation symporter
MLGPFIDTIIICTMTGLVIIVTGAYQGGLSGADLTAQAFGSALPNVGRYIVAIGMAIFAFSTAVSWSYYGDRSVEYLFGERSIMPYRILYCILLPVGATFELRQVWAISDIFKALMAWPNLIGLLLLSGVVVRSTREYFADPSRVNAH